MNILVYTFRTFTYLKEFKDVFPEVVIFEKLKESLQDFYELIVKGKPELILGVALSNKGNSFFEPVAINKFNKNAKVVASGEDKLPLFIPVLAKSNFLLSPKPSSSFCNYTMYKIKHFLLQNNLDTPFAFSHLNKEQIQELPSVITSKSELVLYSCTTLHFRSR